MSRPLAKSRGARFTAAVLLGAGALALSSCGGEEGGREDAEGSGLTAAEIGLDLKPLAEVGLANEVTRLDQGNPPYGATIWRVIQAEDIDGVWVVGAKRGSPSAEAGLGPGDLITAVDGEAVTTPREVNEALGGAEAGSDVEIESVYVLSGDATQFLDPWSAAVKLPGN